MYLEMAALVKFVDLVQSQHRSRAGAVVMISAVINYESTRHYMYIMYVHHIVNVRYVEL
jgi:hypothetical protein